MSYGDVLNYINGCALIAVAVNTEVREMQVSIVVFGMPKD
jgi:hypothetical protein